MVISPLKTKDMRSTSLAGAQRLAATMITAAISSARYIAPRKCALKGASGQDQRGTRRSGMKNRLAPPISTTATGAYAQRSNGAIVGLVVVFLSFLSFTTMNLASVSWRVNGPAGAAGR